MEKSRSKKRKAHQEPKLSFGSALKKNVKINLIIISFYLIQFKNGNPAGQKTKNMDATKAKSRKPYAPSIVVSKLDESYNTDKAPDTITSKEDLEYKSDKKGYLQDIPSEDSAMYESGKVRKIIF